MVRGLGGRGRVMLRPWIPWFEAFLLHNGESEEGRLPQHSDGPGVGDWSQTDIIHLETQHHREKGTTVSVVEQLDTNIAVHTVCPLPLQTIMRFLLSRRIRLTIHIKYKCYMSNISFSARYMCISDFYTPLFVHFVVILHEDDQNHNKYESQVILWFHWVRHIACDTVPFQSIHSAPALSYRGDT